MEDSPQSLILKYCESVGLNFEPTVVNMFNIEDRSLWLAPEEDLTLKWVESYCELPDIDADYPGVDLSIYSKYSERWVNNGFYKWIPVIEKSCWYLGALENL